MSTSFILNLSALLALIPAAVVALRKTPARDGVYWTVMAVAVAGPALWVYVRQAEGWQTGLSTALWLTVVTCLVIYAFVALVSQQGWRLTPLLVPYLILLAVLATIWGQAPSRPLAGGVPLAWIGTHIAVSVATYGLVTLAAISALAAMLQERSLKRRQATGLSRRLPSVADSERLTVRLLMAGEAVLAAGLATGMATLYSTSGRLIAFDHKTVLTLGVFVVVGLLLFLHFRSGIRGRSAARLVLLAYLLFTLGYPGVKLVTDILLV